jgi:DNA-binding MarR family transcriptional regulator
MGKAEMTKLVQTAKRVSRLEAELAQAREQLRSDVAKAHESGESVSEIARRLGVTRARVYQLLGR